MADELSKEMPLAAVELEEISQCKRRIKFSVPIDEVEREFKASYEEVKDTAQIDGFRPGKAPRHVVEMRMGKALRESALSRIRRRALGQAVADHKLKPVGSPQFENMVYEKGTPFTFEATVEVIPDIALPEYKGIKIEKKDPTPATEAEADAELDRLREDYAALNEVKDRPLRDGDFAVATYDEEADGQTEKFEKRLVEVADASLLPGFAEKVRGMRLGEEREFDIQVPEEYSDKEAAGKVVHYRLHLDEIRAKTVPEADDDFAKRVGLESLEDLKRRIERVITERKERECEQEEISQIMTHLLKNTDFQVPQSILAEETRSRMRRRIDAAVRVGTPAERIREAREELLKNAANEAYAGLKLHIIILEIAKSEGIEVSDGEIEARLERLATARNMDKETLKKRYVEEDLLDDIRYDILEQRVVSFLHNSAIKE